MSDGPSILVVDDSMANVDLLRGILKRSGFRDVTATTDPREAVSLFERVKPDLVLLDLHMPEITGFEVMEQVRARVPERAFVPILVLTADVTKEARERALASGAKDFLTKPFDPVEVVLRISNLLETRRLHLALERDNGILEEKVRERTRQLEETQLEILERLARAAEYRDDDTYHHTVRVGEGAARIAEALGLPPPRLELIRHAAPLHDLGKIGVPDAILLKPGPLTGEEMEVVRGHARIGAAMLANGRTPLVRLAEEIALSHHERWDGAGYPLGLAGDAIPIAGRIVAVVDVFDALTHERPYKPAWTQERALEEIRAGRGRAFDPDVVDAFLALR